MADVLDVAEAILQRLGPRDTLSLQKLVYYAQACHLARHGEVLFDAPIKAWVNGPVVPELFHAHKGQFRVSSVGGHPERLAASQQESVNMALRLYGGHNADWLVAQTHAEPPWLDARAGLSPTDKASPRIDPEVMQKYYGRILADTEVEVALAGIDSDTGLTSTELRKRYGLRKRYSA